MPGIIPRLSGKGYSESLVVLKSGAQNSADCLHLHDFENLPFQDR
jgi:hypothetical protein